MADKLEIKLFGPLEVRIGGQPIPHLRTRRGLWVLALLALRRGRDVDRDWVAGTLWPNADEANGRRSLRQSLHDLRGALGAEARRVTSDEPRSLRLCLEEAFVDALDFDVLVERGDEASLERAVLLYRGPLLEDCAEDWALEGRRTREEAYLSALEILASRASASGEYGKAAGHLRAAVAVDPFREELQRALMASLATDGNRAAALLAYRQYRARVAQEMAGEPSAETFALFQRLQRESRAAAKPMRTPASAKAARAAEIRISLPIPLTELIGREKDVREAAGLLSRSRLCTLTGTGGVGKTRLAIQAAKQLAPGFSGGVFFVDLSPLENPELLPEVVRTAIGVPAAGARQGPVEALCSAVGQRGMLIVLDNCEHLGQACGALAQTLLSRCESLKILATSRQTLGIHGEAIWRVPSLSLPDPKLPTTPELLTHFEAVRLFVARAQDQQPTFAVTNQNAPALASVCHRLDGIPLAIELAAARVRHLTVEEIDGRLDQRFYLLTGGSRAVLPRQQTLRSLIDWSYDLLNEAERALLARLSVFSGGWTLESAEIVCSGESIAEWAVLDLLTGLCDQSLVVADTSGSGARYGLLETVRQYARDRMLESGDGERWRDQHLEHFLTLAEEASPGLFGPEQRAWLDRLEEEHDNFRAALARSLGQQRDEAGLRLCAALWRFWSVRGFLAEGRERLQTVLSLPGAAARSVTRARALDGAGLLAMNCGDFEEASAVFEEALSIGGELGDEQVIAMACNSLGDVRRWQRNPVAARSLYERALNYGRAADDRWNVAYSLTALGIMAAEEGNVKDARALLEAGLTVKRELGDTRSIGYSLGYLADLIRAETSDLSAARSLYEEGLRIGEELSDRRRIAWALLNLGLCDQTEGDLTSAWSRCSKSLALFVNVGDRYGTGAGLKRLAEIAGIQGMAECAMQFSDAADRLREPTASAAPNAMTSLTLEQAVALALEVACRSSKVSCDVEDEDRDVIR